jgi:hypothetical protein
VKQTGVDVSFFCYTANPVNKIAAILIKNLAVAFVAMMYVGKHQCSVE